MKGECTNYTSGEQQQPRSSKPASSNGNRNCDRRPQTIATSVLAIVAEEYVPVWQASTNLAVSMS
jgi:hypothetical protein